MPYTQKIQAINRVSIPGSFRKVNAVQESRGLVIKVTDWSEWPDFIEYLAEGITVLSAQVKMPILVFNPDGHLVCEWPYAQTLRGSAASFSSAAIALRPIS